MSAVPNGFATTAEAFRRFLEADGLGERIAERIKGLDTDDTRALAAAGKDVRGWITEQDFPDGLEDEIGSAFETLVEEFDGDADR